jgi:hypothetical protein
MELLGELPPIGRRPAMLIYRCVPCQRVVSVPA